MGSSFTRTDQQGSSNGEPHPEKGQLKVDRVAFNISLHDPALFGLGIARSATELGWIVVDGFSACSCEHTVNESISNSRRMPESSLVDSSEAVARDKANAGGIVEGQV